MKNNLNAFERGLKDKLENFEMPHSEHEWSGIQGSLGAKTFSWAKAIIIGGIAVGGSLAIYLISQNNEKLLCQKAENITRFNEPINIFNLATANQNTEAPSVLNLTETDQQSNHTNSNGVSAEEKEPSNTGDAQRTTAMLNSTENSSGAKIETLEPSKVISLASNVRKACMGEEVLFSMSNGPKGGSYLWNFGDGHFSDESNPKHRFNKAGKYDVSLSITTEDGQINTTVMSDMINIIESPDAYFFWEFADGAPSEPIAIIREESFGAETYQWTLPDGQKISDREPGKLKLLTGSNRIILRASNSNGCYTEVERVIQVKENSDPNTVHGGESFMPQFLKKNKGRFVLSIFDSSGNKVYETSNRTKGWDGKSAHSRSINNNFRWKAVLTDEKSDESQYIFGTFNIQP